MNAGYMKQDEHREIEQMTLVAGVDSSTRSCKVVIRDAHTGALVRAAAAPHPPGTEVDPEHWWEALQRAVERAGGLDDVATLSVAGQQHGLVALDVERRVIRPAPVWNDMRSAPSAEDLIAEAGAGDRDAGARWWAKTLGVVHTSSFTVAKLRWLRDHEAENASQLAAIALPHDWLTWRPGGGGDLSRLVTDRSEASGTGYFDSVAGAYCRDLIALALRGDVEKAAALVLPRVASGAAAVDRGAGALSHIVLGPGLGDNAAAALALRLRKGRAMVSVGTSGVVGTVGLIRANDPAGLVAGFTDGTGHFLHLAVTVNAARVLDATATLFGIDHATLDEWAIAAEPGSAGMTYVPYLEGERTPNRPSATGVVQGLTLVSMTAPNFARATVEGLLCHLAEVMDTIRAQGVRIEEVTLIGGAARSEAMGQLVPAVFGVPVTVPEVGGEYVADGAALQAAWVLPGSERPPTWQEPEARTFVASPQPSL